MSSAKSLGWYLPKGLRVQLVQERLRRVGGIWTGRQELYYICLGEDEA